MLLSLNVEASTTCFTKLHLHVSFLFSTKSFKILEQMEDVQNDPLMMINLETKSTHTNFQWTACVKSDWLKSGLADNMRD